MKTLQNPAHFAFTNHFNKSLLTSRIVMMNRKKSKWLGLGKYGLFIGMLWVCAAFTKPYREEIARKIVLKVPQLKAVLLPESIAPLPLHDFIIEAAPTAPVIDAAHTAVPSFTETDTLVSQTKYVIYKDRKLHWVVTPMMGYDEFIAILNEFEKVGANFFVKHFRHDPLGKYLLGITLKTSFLKEGQDCYMNVFSEGHKPIAAFGGWVSMDSDFCSIDKNSFDPQFKPIVDEVNDKISDWLIAHVAGYHQIQVQKEIADREREWYEYERQWNPILKKYHSSPLKTPNGLARFRPDALQYLYETGARNRIYFEDKALRIENLHKSSEFIINNQLGTLQQAEQLTFDQIMYVVSYAIYTDSTRRTAQRTLAIFTKDSIKP